jgi:hypothetical protein
MAGTSGDGAWQASDVDLAALRKVEVTDGSTRAHSMALLLADDHVVVTLLLRRYG